MNKRLERRLLSVLKGMSDNQSGDLVFAVVDAASRYWADSDADDFCVQLVSIEGAVFGGTNRLLWSPAYGFRPDRLYCTERFLATCDRLGPLPKDRT